MKPFHTLSAVFGILIGIVLVVVGVWGIAFTREMVSREKIVTPSDSSTPNTAVVGPLTLKAQADVIREHVLAMTGGKTFAEMPRDDKRRDIWVTATTLTTALHLGIFAYAFSGLILLLGAAFFWLGIVAWKAKTR